MSVTLSAKSRKERGMGWWQKLKKEKTTKTRKRPRCEVDNTIFDSLPICGIQVKFPKGVKLYPSQKLIIARILTALNKKQNVLAESPTGSGKTLALLASTCAWIVNYQTQRKEAKASCPVHGVDNKFQEEYEPADESLMSTTLNDSDVVVLDDDENVKPPNTHEDEFEKDFMSSPMVNKVKIMRSMGEAKKLECSCLPRVRIYYGTRTHKQIGQVVKEFSRLPYAGIVKHTILASREQSCINESVRNSYDLTAKCKETLSNNGPGCMHKSNIRTFKMDQPKPMRSHIEQTGPTVFDIEDLVSVLKEESPSLCPYFASTRILTQDADLIFCPFSYLVDPIIRHSSDVILKNSIILLDEAHNIEDTCRDSASFTFYEKEIGDALASLKQKEQDVHESLMSFTATKPEDETVKAKLIEFSKSYGVLVKLVTNIREWFTQRAFPVLQEKQDFNKSRQKTDSWAVLKDSLVSFKCAPPLLVAQSSPEYEMIMDCFNSFTGQNEDPTANAGIDHLKPSGVAIVLVEKWMYFQTFFSKPDYQTCYRLNILLEAVNHNNSYAQHEISSSQGPKNSKYNEAPDSPWLDSTTGPLGLRPIVSGMKSSFSFWCMSPEITFMDAFRESRSVILASGTLCPTETLQTELGMDFSIQVEGRQVIEDKNIFAAILPIGPNGTEIAATATNLSQPAVIQAIVDVIENITELVPKGVLVFLPSYRTLSDIMQKMKVLGVDKRIQKKKVILEEPRRSSDLAAVMDNYTAAIKDPHKFGASVDGAIMFAVFRGKISEGIDFADDLARVVLSIGIPYPYIGEGVVKEKKKYNSERAQLANTRILNGDQWYHTQAYRALNQALGRGLRHKNDWSALIMLDSRLRNQVNPTGGQSSTRVSKWIRERSIFYRSYSEFVESLQRYVKTMTEPEPC